MATETAHLQGDYFQLRARDTTLAREIVAGISTYLSLAYIFIVNPSILSSAHMNGSAVLFATAIASGLATIAMGVWAKLPFAVAPGLEMSGFFTFVVVNRKNYVHQTDLYRMFK